MTVHNVPPSPGHRRFSPMTVRFVVLALLGVVLVSCGAADDPEVATHSPAGTAAEPAAQSDEAAEPAAQSDEADAAQGGGSELTLGTAGSWTPEDVAGIEIGPSNSIPEIDPALADERVYEDLWAWDWWPVRTRTGEVAEIDGWQIAIALAAPADVLPGKRHDIATHHYAISRDQGQTWTHVGEVFGNEPLGSRQWAGSAMYDEDENRLYAFYTAAGVPEDPVEEAAQSESADDAPIGPSGGPINDGISYRQQLALATATVEAGDQGVDFVDWSDHTVLFNGGDTEFYSATEATEGGAGNIDAFRDPWYYLDEDTGEEFLLFTATMPSADCDGDGVVGIARATSDDLRDYEILPPLLDGHCVNNELERPHIIEENGRTYLLFTTHSHTFRDDTSGPEGYYGFVADDLMGAYEPLNGTGLVLANPADDPYQAYSWMGLPGGVITSFFQYFGVGSDVDLSYIGTQTPEYQLEHFAGTFAPSLHVRFDGATTELVEVLGPGVLAAPAQDDGEEPTGDTGDQPAQDDGDEPTGDTGDQPAQDDGDQPTGDTGDQPAQDDGEQPTGDTGQDMTPEGGAATGFGGAAATVDDGSP